jgi:acetamidase/formamidase
MTVHHVEPTVYHNTFGPHTPLLRIGDGDTVVTTTADARGFDRRGEQVAERPNPQTGPFYVEGAEPGDAVAIHLERVYPNRATGWTYSSVAPNVVEPSYVPDLPERALVTWDLDLAAGTAKIANPTPGLRDLILPLAPMLGCLGVAPDHGQAIYTATSGTHGGNMDYRGYVEGTTAYFPVFVPGALIHLGDGHAVQGDGEIVGTGIETSFEVRFTVHLLKGKEMRWPRGETADHIFTVGNARPLDQAIQHATTEMLRWLQEDYDLSGPEASTLLGQVVAYDVGNIYDPAYTMVCKVPKRVIPHPSGR